LTSTLWSTGSLPGEIDHQNLTELAIIQRVGTLGRYEGDAAFYRDRIKALDVRPAGPGKCLGEQITSRILPESSRP
jgi:hypothetical protein